MSGITINEWAGGDDAVQLAQQAEARADAGLRPITREHEARVRAALDAAVGHGAERPLKYSGDRLTSICGEHYSAGFVTVRQELARAGIVPGPEGWCWAESVTQEPPAWLTEAVLKALPVDGTPVSPAQIDGGIDRPAHDYTLDDLHRALNVLVMRGEAEIGPDRYGAPTWRRWGVPEGYAWSTYFGVVSLADAQDRRVIEVAINGQWAVASVQSATAVATGCADGATDAERVAAAKRAALRACWEHGLLAPLAPTQPKVEPVADVPKIAPREARYAAVMKYDQRIREGGSPGPLAGQCRHPHCRAEAPHRQGDEACDMNAESVQPAERLPDPAAVAFSPECQEIDRLAVTLFADLDALAKQSPGPRIETMREAVRDLAALAERLLRQPNEARLEAEAATTRAYKTERELSMVREALDALCERLAKGRAT